MNKFIKVALSLILCLAFILSAASCELVDKIRGVEYVPDHPPGYTGGVSMESHLREITEVHWVETYDEAMYIVEQLKAYGNEFSEVLISSYENETVDAKYCFGLNISKTRKQKIGEEWYQRKFKSVRVGYCAFLDEVSIEELEYSNYRFYKCFAIYNMLYRQYDFYEMSKNLVFECENDGVDSSIVYDDCTCRLINTETGLIVTVAGLNYYNFTNHYDELPENFHDDFLKTLVVIGGN